MPTDFKATQVRVQKIIASGSSTKPYLLMYPSGSASNETGGLVNMTGTGSDGWLFVSGGVAASDKVVFGGDITVSGTVHVNPQKSAAPDFRIDGTSVNLFFADVSEQKIAISGSFVVTGSSILSSSLTVTGSSIVTGSFTVTGSSTVTGSFTVTGSSILSSSLTVIGSSIVNGSLTVTGSSTVTGSFVVTGSSILSSSLTVIGSSIVNGSSTVTGSFTVTGSSIITGSFTVTGSSILSSSLTVIGSSIVNGSSTVTGPLVVTGSFIVSGSAVTSPIAMFGIHGTQLAPLSLGNDAFFFVSGNINPTLIAPDYSRRGTAIFGGDVVASGSLFGGPTLKIGSPTDVRGGTTIYGTLTTSGSVHNIGLVKFINVTSAAVDISGYRYVKFTNTPATITCNLPSPTVGSSLGRIITLARGFTSTAAVTITTPVGNIHSSVADSPNYTLANVTSWVEIICDGANWVVTSFGT